MTLPSPAAVQLGTAPTHTRTLRDGCAQLGGCIANSSIPGWCAYCGAQLPPAWDWVTARQEVIVRAAREARWQRKARQIGRRRAEPVNYFEAPQWFWARSFWEELGMVKIDGAPRPDPGEPGG